MFLKIFTSFISTFVYIFIIYNLKIIKFEKKFFLINFFILYLISYKFKEELCLKKLL